LEGEGEVGEHGGLAGEEAAGGEDDVGEVLEAFADVVSYQIKVDGLWVQGGRGQDAVPIWGVAIGRIRGGGLGRCGKDGGDGVGLAWGEVEEGEEEGGEVLPMVGMQEEDQEETAGGDAGYEIIEGPWSRPWW